MVVAAARLAALLVVLAICCTGAHAAEGRWSSAGPYGGRVDSAVLGTGEPGVVYASAHRSVYRSIDGGASWRPAAAGLSTITPGETVLAAHPSRPGTLVLAGARGVFLTEDGARTWSRRDNGLPVNGGGFRTVDIAFAPSDPDMLYLASEDDGLYRSTNGGTSWAAVAVSSLPTDLDRVAVDPANPLRVLVWALNRNEGDFPASLYLSVDGGSSFTGVAGPWDGQGPIREPLNLLAFAGNKPGTVFLSGPFGNFRSLNGGASFTALPALPLGASQRLQSLAFDPAVAGRALFGTSDGVLLTVDNGANFVVRNGGLSVANGDPASIGPILIDPANANRWLAFSLAGEVFVSLNAGLGWSAASAGLRGTAIQTVAVHPTRPQRVFAGLRNLRSEATSPALYQSDDTAQSWLRFNSALVLDTVNAIAFDPGTVNVPGTTRIYAGGADFAPTGQAPTAYRGGVHRSLDGGLTWAAADNLLPLPTGGPAATGEVSALLVDPGSVSLGNAQILYFAARGLVRCIGGVPNVEVARVWRSNDASASWVPRDGLPNGVCTPRTQWAAPTSLAFDPGSTTTLYAGLRIQGYCADCGDPVPTVASGVCRSSNSGVSWTAVNNGLPLMSGSGSVLDVVALASVPGLPGTLYAALNDPTVEDDAGRVFKTTDGGANWSPADDGIVGLDVRALRVDPTTPNRVFAGVAGFELTPGGVYLSENGGGSWDSVSIDLPVDSAQSLALSLPVAGPPTLHAGTDEGVWSITRVPDGDIDGPPDATEDLAPNAGDGNSDGQPDRLQAGVASFEIPATLLPVVARGSGRQGTVSNTDLRVVGGACEQVYDTAAIDPLALPDDPGFVAEAGVVRLRHSQCAADLPRRELRAGLAYAPLRADQRRQCADPGLAQPSRHPQRQQLEFHPHRQQRRGPAARAWAYPVRRRRGARAALVRQRIRMSQDGEPATSQFGATVVAPNALPSRVGTARPAPDPLAAGPAAWIGREIDDYRILRVLGAGGMGVVFLAQQRHPKRLVAIKTLHAGLHQAELLARFQQEAEILGRLKHPGIAQIHASGRTDASLGGVPYIVMEFVEGVPLLEHSGTLPMRQCLELLMRICEAVEHAHIRGVIHRDLKPGNILVQPDGQPKVLDFGVARLTGEDRGPSELTSAGMVIGTIAFMSPEQAQGEPGAVDIRSDVYALGMIGYRMLTGDMPYEVTGHNLARALQQICDTAPKPLSQHDRRYRGDLETIFQKVLAKDKEARYQNAAEFAEDLRRYLADEAILARRPSVLSDIRRFARRNKILVGAAVAVLASLVAAVAVSTRFALEEQAQRIEADAMVDYMHGMFSGANPVFAQGEDVSVRTLIEQAEQQLQRDLANAPAARGRIRATLAETFQALGELDRALAYYNAASADFVAAGSRGLEPELVDLGAARVLFESGRVREARQRLDALLAAPGEDVSPARVMARLNLAVALAAMGENQAANSEFARGFELLARSGAMPCKPCLPQWALRHEIWARAQQSLLQTELGELEAAMSSAERAFTLARDALDDADPYRLTAVAHVSMALQEHGEHKQAITLLQNALAERQNVLKDSHLKTIATANNLARALADDGQAAEAESMYRHWLAIAESALDAQNPELATIKANLGNLLFNEGRTDEATTLLADAYARRVSRLGIAHPSTLKTARNLAVMYAAQAKSDPARFDDAERLMRAALDGTIARFGADHRQTIDVRSEYASVLRDRARYVEADREFAQAWTLAERLLPPGDSDRLRVLFQYSGSLQRQQRYAEAEVLSARLMAEIGQASDPNAQHARMAPLRHARSLIGLKRFDEAERLLLDFNAGIGDDADETLRRQTRATLAELYTAAGREAEAARYR